MVHKWNKKLKRLKSVVALLKCYLEYSLKMLIYNNFQCIFDNDSLNFHTYSDFSLVRKNTGSNRCRRLVHSRLEADHFIVNAEKF